MSERCSLPGTSRLLDGGRRRHAGELARLAEVIAGLLAAAADRGLRLRAESESTRCWCTGIRPLCSTR
jgi:hypothetical protein